MQKGWSAAERLALLACSSGRREGGGGGGGGAHTTSNHMALVAFVKLSASTRTRSYRADPLVWLRCCQPQDRG